MAFAYRGVGLVHAALMRLVMIFTAVLFSYVLRRCRLGPRSTVEPMRCRQTWGPKILSSNMPRLTYRMRLPS